MPQAPAGSHARPTNASLSAGASRYCPSCQATIEQPDRSVCPECAVPRPDSVWPRDGRLGRIVVGGQYRVLRRLGSGGFGTVYLVETVVGGLRRALKVLHSEWAGNAEMRERFINEALVLEQVNHPNVARCYAVGMLEEDEDLYLLLELVQGVPLSRLLVDETGALRPLAPVRAANLAKQIASGLVVAHANQVLHRDLKPDNILVVDAGTPQERVKLIDFGIAKSIARGATSTHGLLGTPLYMAPEQLDPGNRLDRRVDLWQLGATLFLMLTGRPPYDPDGGIVQLIAQHADRLELGPSPMAVDAGLASAPDLDRLTRQLLATDPEHRPRSAAKVCEELARLEHALTPGVQPESSLALLEALCGTPSPAGWWSVCRYLAEPATDRSALVSAADRLLVSWPDEYRVAPTGWWDQVKCGQEHPLWPLARTLDLGGRDLRDDGVAEVVGTPALVSITRLCLAHNEIGNEGVAAVARSPHLRALRVLDLCGNRVTSDGVSELVSSDHLRGLRALRLAGNGVGPRGADALAAANLSLHELDLSDNEIGASGARALAASEALRGLEVLVLRGNALGSDGAGAVAVSPSLGALRVLDLGHNDIGPSGAAALALSSNVGRLHSLCLAQNQLGVHGVELLLASSRFEALESLDLSSNQLGAPGAMRLASSLFARRLKRLDLHDNELSDAGLAALLGAAHLSGLRSLGVAQNDLTAAGAMLLGGAPPELEALDLSMNDLGPTGGTALAQSLGRMRIRRLDVTGCGLSGDGVVAVLDGGGGRLDELMVADNGIGAAGAARIGSLPVAAALRRLDVSRNDLGIGGLEALGGSPHLKGIRSLRLASNGLGDAAGARIATALEAFPSLRVLDLSDNGLGVATATALARSALTGRLSALDLSFNQLADPGAAALVHGHAWHALHSLDLERNDIGLGAAATLLAAPGTRQLSRVNLAHNAMAGLVDVHSLAQQQIALLESSFATIATEQADFAERFYQALFARYPSIKPLFARTSMKRQQQHLLSTLAMVIDNLRNPDVVQRGLLELGTRHVGYGVCPSHYHAVASMLLETIRQAVGPAWSEALDETWRDALDAVCRGMIQAGAARTDDAGDPPARPAASGCPVMGHGVM